MPPEFVLFASIVWPAGVADNEMKLEKAVMRRSVVLAISAFALSAVPPPGPPVFLLDASHPRLEAGQETPENVHN